MTREVKALFAQSGVKIEMPGEGMRGAMGEHCFDAVYRRTRDRARCLPGEYRPGQKHAREGTAHDPLQRRGGHRRSQRRGVRGRGFPAQPEEISNASAARCPKACCSSARREPARRCSPKPSPARRTRAFSACTAAISRKCLSASAPSACARFSARRAKHKPAIIFIDEIDCVGKNRKFDSHGEHQQTINALLAAMDGFQSSEGIVVIAATNRPEDLDDALMRPGPFRPQGVCPLPRHERPARDFAGARARQAD